MAWTFDRILKGARRLSASDVHLVRGVAPALRIAGEIRLLEGDALQEEDLRELLAPF
jgi:Tfp pilus assembly pilus retraction ATPase PilT